MKPEKQIEAMARLDGLIRATGYDGWRTKNYTVIDQLPAYLTSHDAVQKVIDGFSGDETRAYWNHLATNWAWDYESVHATPEQKVEAILKAKGVWAEEGKGYQLDCPQCHGTGCVSQARYDPPEECDCWTREAE